MPSPSPDSVTSSDPDRRQLSQRALLWIVASGFFMQTLDTTIVNTALPAMAGSLGEPVLAMHPVVVAYTLTMASLTPASGWLADRFGTRRMYFATILVFVIGSILCATATTLPQLLAARVVQGIGGSMLLPVGRLAVLRSVPGAQYIAALASISIAGQLGPVVGPVLGGWLVQSLSWHWIFLINVPIGTLGMIAVLRYLPDDSLPAAPRFDVRGCALLSGCMVAFSLALDVPFDQHRLAWSAALMTIATVAVWCYVRHARRDANPLFRLGLFGEPNFSIGLVGNLVCRIGSSAVPFLLPLLLQVRLGYTPLQSGLVLLPAAIAGTIAKPWIAPLVKRYGYDNFLLVNTAVVGLAIVSFALITPGWPLALGIAQLAIFGAANSMQFAAMNSVTLKGLGRADAGSGNSLFSMVQMLAIGLGVTIGGAMVNQFKDASGAATSLSFQITFVIVGLITLASAWVFRRMDARYFT
ncbi:DHA2 family efflux MFS transporter permease subunit [Herbaspirillum sp. alder98]|uniref:DHA2 family efflux MFS transporter permease subunit n=1 Tax=Herbaspirillum sp. alder98 TaxID=2913096 RepID=UPI001CD8DF47|nr:DHA2 family efflux MFS transporter permease subunit [Herbaspirillum sp. alder98]MCA1324692.1 DHA2 family efflux MFS transporter permease subunit [Herbaspirillum sp. alder98]